MRCFIIAIITSSICLAQSENIFDFWTDIFRPIPKNTDEGFVPDYFPKDKQEFDFIIIGAGSAGCVLANRLSEISKWDVLLLESGGNENFFSDIPIFAPFLSITPMNWDYSSEPEKKACKSLRGNVCYMPRGKVLGGSSVLNFLIYQRGHPEDYNDWAKMGNEGWSYDKILPYFKKSENIKIPELRNSSFHGIGGYLDIDHATFSSPLEQAFRNAGLQLGYEWNDPNGEKVIGFSKPQATIRNGRRCSSSKAFLEPVRFRRNLKVSKFSTVKRLLIDPDTKTAVGVEFMKHNKRRRVYARKEIVLAAGTIGSAQLLMLSGVGPTDHLREVGIDTLFDSPVGYNLQDHVTFSGNAFIVNETGLCVNDMLAASPVSAAEYLAGQGPLTIPGGAAGLAFTRTQYANDLSEGRPDLELVMGAGSLAGDFLGIIRSLLGVTDDFYWRVYGNLPLQERQRTFSLNPVLIRPQSYGRLLLRSAKFDDNPKIHPNYFDHPDDIKVLKEGIRLESRGTFIGTPPSDFGEMTVTQTSSGCIKSNSESSFTLNLDNTGKVAQKVIGTRSFQKYGTRLNNIPFPGCEQLRFDSDEYWECAIMQTSITLDHQVGTCKMGPKGDPTAVVSPRLLVNGIKNLRVADASIMPRIPASHTHAPVVMIAEKASDMIKNDWGIPIQAFF